MKLSILAGATSQTVNVFIRDSTSTTGAGLTGLVFNSAGLTAYYALSKAAAVQITLATLAAITTAWSSGGFKEVDATNMPGWYRLDIPDAALASGRFVSIHLKGATNMAPLPLEIELTAWNNQDGVRGGMTALPNAAAEAAGGLYTRGAGAGQIAQQANGQADVNLSTIKTQAVTCGAGVTVLASVGTAATSTAQTGDNYARLGAPAGASVSVDIAAVKVDTAAVKAKTDNLPAAPAAVGDIPTANQNADALLDRAAGVEANRTPRQALRLMLATLAGKLSGAATATVTIRDTNDSKDRVVATVDADGNRSAVTLDAS